MIQHLKTEVHLNCRSNKQFVWNKIKPTQKPDLKIHFHTFCCHGELILEMCGGGKPQQEDSVELANWTVLYFNDCLILLTCETDPSPI